MLSNRVYDIMKWVTMVVLPATATLYVTLADIWGLPAPDSVSVSIMAVVTFLGVLLGVSSNNYTPPTAGTLFVNQKDGSVYAGFKYEPKHLAEQGDTVVKMDVSTVQ